MFSRSRVFRRFNIGQFSTAASEGTGETASKPNYAGIAFFGAICLTSAGLGCWQVQRYYWKTNLIEEIKNRAVDGPVGVSDDDSLAEINEMKGKRVIVRGHFDHKNEVLLGPRTAPPGVFEAAQGLVTNPQGYFVITPFIRQDTSTVVFVNRGWVPARNSTWERPTGLATITCVVSEMEKKATFSPINNPSTKKLLWLEESSLLTASGITSNGRPVCKLDIVGATFHKGSASTEVSNEAMKFPVGKPFNNLHEQSVDPATHVAYAFTWFSLAAVGSYMTYSMFGKKKILNKIPK